MHALAKGMFGNNSYKSKEKVCMPWLRVYLAITLTKARKKYALLTYLVEQGYIAIIFTMSMEKVCMPKKYGGRLHIVLYVVNFDLLLRHSKQNRGRRYGDCEETFMEFEIVPFSRKGTNINQNFKQFRFSDSYRETMYCCVSLSYEPNCNFYHYLASISFVLEIFATLDYLRSIFYLAAKKH